MPEKVYKVGCRIGNCEYNGGDFYIGKRRWALFKCECGISFEAEIQKIRILHTKSCGCLARKLLLERNTKHGNAIRGSKPKEYNIWVLIKQRCSNPKSKGFKNWGGRGISVCKRWAVSYDNFIEDMGTCPSGCRGLDRIDNNGDYEPSNCRWATQSQQMRNMRRNRIIEYVGVKKTLAEWAEQLKMPRGSFYSYKRKGLNDSEILEIYNRKMNGE